MAFIYMAAVVPLMLAVIAIIVKNYDALSHAQKKRTKLELVLLGLIIATALYAIYFNYYTGKFVWSYTDVGTDTFEQYIPFYINLIGNVQDGTVAIWNTEFGLGVNLPAYQSWFMDPFNLIVVPLGLVFGVAYLSPILVVAQSVKIFLSAYLFDHFLTRYCKTPLARVLGSSIYALCGFMVLNGQHYWLGSAFPIFTLTILVFEFYAEKRTVKRFIGVVLVVVLQLIWSVYIAFMILLFEALYLLVRIPCYLEKTTFKTYMLAVGKMVLPVVCGMVLSGFMIVPYTLFLVGETSRTSANTSTVSQIVTHLGFINADWIPAVLSRALGSGLVNTGSNPTASIISDGVDVSYVGSFPYEYIFLGFSVGFFVFVGQFFHWVYTECSKKDKILVSIGTALLLLYCFNQLLPTIFTMLVRLQYRSSFVLAAPMCVALALGLEKRIMPGKIALVPLLISVVLTAAALAWSYAKASSGRLETYAFAVLLVLLAAIMFWNVATGKWAPVYVSLCVAMLIASQMVDGFFCTNIRLRQKPEAFAKSAAASGYDADTIAALTYIAENDPESYYYRIDESFAEWTPLNDSLIEHFDSASMYNSSMDADIDEFYDKLWYDAVVHWAAYSQGFKNDPDQPAIANLLALKYVLSDWDLDYEWLTLEAQFGEMRVYKNKTANLASVRQCVVSESEANALADASGRRDLLATSIIVPDEVAAASDTALTAEEATVNGSGASSDATATSIAVAAFTQTSETEFTGTVNVENNSYVSLSIPNTGTWHVYVDGQEAETFRANYGFIGFEVTAGTHNVTATYELNGIRQGAILSAAGAAITVLSILYVNSRVRREAQAACLPQA